MAGLRSLFGLRREPRFTIKWPYDRPDIVLFLTDEQRHDEVGYASGGYHETPHLDRLADQGVVFETAYSGSTVCVPSRACLLTGLEHHRVPKQAGGLALQEGYWTIARALKSVGYKTALVGKMHFSPMYADHGFDVVKLAEHLVPFSGYKSEEVDDYHRFLLWEGLADHGATHMFGPGLEDAAGRFNENYFAEKFPYDASLHPIGWIARTASEILAEKRYQPLFIVVSFPRPHAPFDPAEPYASRYSLSDARLPADDAAMNEALPETFRTPFVFDEKQFFNPFFASNLSEERYRRVLTYVRALVKQIDDAMGQVLEHVDELRSAIFFTSDHGTYGGHRGLLGKVPWIPFEDLARVPFVCRAPGALAGTVVKEPVQSYDFVATCLDYAGIEPPPGVLDAVSLRRAIQGLPAPADRVVFSSESVGWPMARKGALKLIRGPWATEAAFDLERDPRETRSVHEDRSYAGALAELRAALDQMAARTTPDLPGPPPAFRRTG